MPIPAGNPAGRVRRPRRKRRGVDARHRWRVAEAAEPRQLQHRPRLMQYRYMGSTRQRHILFVAGDRIPKACVTNQEPGIDVARLTGLVRTSRWIGWRVLPARAVVAQGPLRPPRRAVRECCRTWRTRVLSGCPRPTGRPLGRLPHGASPGLGRPPGERCAACFRSDHRFQSPRSGRRPPRRRRCRLVR